jgi:hypothetical protein
MAASSPRRSARFPPLPRAAASFNEKAEPKIITRASIAAHIEAERIKQENPDWDLEAPKTYALLINGQETGLAGPRETMEAWVAVISRVIKNSR